MIILLPEKLSLNKFFGRMHWTARKRIVDEWDMVMMPFKRKLKPEKTPTGVTYDFFLKGKLLDVSNCFAMVKLLEDSMVRNGILEDDSPKYIREITVSVQKGDNEVDITFY